MRRVEVSDGDVAEEALFAPHRVQVLGRLHVTKRKTGRGEAERRAREGERLERERRYMGRRIIVFER